MTKAAPPATEDPSEPVPEAAWYRLRDGRRVCVRGVSKSDGPVVRDFVRLVSQESLELRFFSAVQSERVVAEILPQSSPPYRVSVLLENWERDGPRIIGHAEYMPDPKDPTRAEVAFLVADEFQGHGGGTLLLRHLGMLARREGIQTFTAFVLCENKAMRDAFTGAGFPYTIVYEGTEALLELDVQEEARTSLAIIEDRSDEPMAPT
jgi:GNAT superfamily N-acetyltransferase